jgi:hypothetical protein
VLTIHRWLQTDAKSDTVSFEHLVFLPDHQGPDGSMKRNLHLRSFDFLKVSSFPCINHALARFDTLTDVGYFGQDCTIFHELPALDTELVQFLIGWFVSFKEGDSSEKIARE